MMVIDSLNSLKGKDKTQMDQQWKYQSVENNTISLHDCIIDRVEISGGDVILYFDEYGFNVTKDNSLNLTGRHRNTGPAAVILKNGCYQTLISKESFAQELIEGEILKFEWNQDLRLFTLKTHGFRINMSQLMDDIYNICTMFGCYVFETARRNYGGEYYWLSNEQQPILVADEPDFSVSIKAWEKIKGYTVLIV